MLNFLFLLVQYTYKLLSNSTPFDSSVPMHYISLIIPFQEVDKEILTVLRKISEIPLITVF